MNRQGALPLVPAEAVGHLDRRDLRRMLEAGCRSTRALVFTHLVVVPLLVSVLLSLVLIERKYSLLAASFLTTKTLGAISFPLFVLASALMDLTVLQSVLVPWAGLSRLLKLGYRPYAVTYIAGATAAVVVVNALAYNLMSYLGDLIRLKAVLQVSDGLAGTIPYVLSWLPGHVLLVVLASVAAAGSVWLLWRMSAHTAPGQIIGFKGQIGRLVALWLMAALVEGGLTRAGLDHPIATNLRRTCLHRAVAAGLAWATDFDGDRHGWIDFPPDFAPFDPRRHPFACEIPGNGIDEDGIGGDLPALLPVPIVRRPTHVQNTPDIVLVIECSLRPDVIWNGQFGPGVMPRLQQLARTGFYTDQVYSHNGFTTSALRQILSGQIADGEDSLIRDFKAFAYQVGVFSCQDDDFGSVRQTCALDEADRYFNATLDPQSRLTTFTAASSMTLSAGRVQRELAGFLAGSDRDRPLFALVFLASTHFPYGFDCPKDIVPHRVLSTRDMCPARRADLVATYRNAAANLDEQIGELYELVMRTRSSPRRGEPVVIIAGDHGESLFDDGMLGHGLVLNDVQTRVPLVIMNGWGRLPVPLGLVDLRPFLLSMLAGPKPEHAVVTTCPAEQPVFQYCGPFGLPLQIGLVTAAGRRVVDFDRRTFTSADGRIRPFAAAAGDPEFLHVIHQWESLRYVAVHHQSPGQNTPPEIRLADSK